MRIRELIDFLVDTSDQNLRHIYINGKILKGLYEYQAIQIPRRMKK
jgi:hypothetical protein